VHKHKGKFIRHQSDTNVSVKVSVVLHASLQVAAATDPLLQKRWR